MCARKYCLHALQLPTKANVILILATIYTYIYIYMFIQTKKRCTRYTKDVIKSDKD